jgi:hypothetical protein
LTQYIEDHGEVAPDDINWGHVGQMTDLASTLTDQVNWIDGKGEYAALHASGDVLPKGETGIVITRDGVEKKLDEEV